MASEEIVLRPTHVKGTTLISSHYPESSSDDVTLRRLGKRPLLDRSFGFISSLGLSCTVLVSWEGILFTSVSTLVNVGPGGVIWAFLVGWVGITSVYAVLAELASIAPTASGQYHWVAMMAPKRSASFLAYLTAWLTTLAWQAIATATCLSIATLIQGITVLSRPSYAPLPWHTVLIMFGVTLLSVLVNSTTGKILAKLEGLFLVLHLTGFFGVLVPLVYFAPHNSPAEVFTTFYNNGHWSTQAHAFFVGLPNVAATLFGADSAVHMSEEVRSANTVVPQSLLYTIAINGLLGFAMTVAFLFCLSDAEGAIEAADTMYYPFLQVFHTAVKSTTGASLMAGVVLVLVFASSISQYATASRMIWSFARDKGLPFDRQLVRLNRNSLPLYAILSTMVITTLLSLIVLGSEVVLSALFSLLSAALCSSYLLACGLLLWRRSQGTIQPYTSNRDSAHPGQLTWGPWRVPEPLGTINNAFACIFILVLWFWSFWPSVSSPALTEVNWSPLVYGSVILFSVAWYVIRARHYFNGPVMEV
ncbi:amino acid transporter [Xylariomycetidae sp. FL2044]|nr:amino acid transporter [Xylariomycetidae sp. FL2044]